MTRSTWTSRGTVRRGVAGLAAALALGPGAAVAAAPATGVIEQKQGRAGCISQTGTRGACANGRSFERVAGIALSADGKSAYVASPITGLAVLDRDLATGALTQKAGPAGCLSDLESGCLATASANAEYAVAVSPDDKNVYSAGLDGVSVLDRDPATGALSQRTGTSRCFDKSADGCTRVPSIDFPDTLAVSPDGLNVYVASLLSDSVTIFDRDAAGALRAKAGRDGCLSANGSGGRCARAGYRYPGSVTVSPDGRTVYVGADGVIVFDRAPGGTLTRKPGRAGCVTEDGSRGRCANGTDVSGVSSVAISGDGKSLYVASGDAVGIFDRDVATGAIAQKRGRAGCISDDGSSGGCTNGKALRSAEQVRISVDGLSVYLAAEDAVSSFDRNPATGTLRQKRRLAGCVSENGSRGVCANGKALRQPRWLEISPDARNVYVGVRLSDAVAIFDRR